MKTVKEVSALSGVSVRTLHYYDEIGLLKPTEVTEAGYRLYDDDALCRLQSILLFRELEFPLRDIKAILETPDFDRNEALSRQIRLLELQKEHIEGLLKLAREQRETGGKKMDFSAFDQTKLDEYKKEAKERWGNTAAFAESERRAKKRTGEEETVLASGMMKIFEEFGAIKTENASGAKAQELVSKLQSYITENYYLCTKEIFRGLGLMYVEDERFRENIDKAGGTGTAAFAAKAICLYCEK